MGAIKLFIDKFCRHAFDRSNCHPSNSWLFPNIFNVMRLVSTFNKRLTRFELSFDLVPSDWTRVLVKNQISQLAHRPSLELGDYGNLPPEGISTRKGATLVYLPDTEEESF